MMVINFIKNNIVSIGIISLLVFLLLLSDYKRNQDISLYQTNINIKNNEIKKRTLKNGDTVISKQALIVTDKEFKNQIFIKDSIIEEMTKKFKRIKASVVINTVTEIREVQVPYNVPIDFDFDKPFTYKEDNFAVFGRSNQNGLYDVGIDIESSFRFITGQKKSFWKKTIETDLVVSNPLVRVTGLSTQVTDIKTKRFGIGPFAGIDYQGKPTIGIGLVFTPIQF